MSTLGVLGVGDLTENMLRGLHRAHCQHTVVLSPRNAQRAQALGAAFGWTVLPSNQAVVDASDVLLVGVRPSQLPALAEEVRVRPAQPLMSVVTGVPLHEFQRLFPSATCSRAMLSAAAEINRSSVAVYPADSAATQWLAPLGTLLAMQTEREFELATVGACINGWLYRLLHELQQWATAQGISPEQARTLVLSAADDCIAYSQHHSKASMGDIGSAIAQPGTFTAVGLEVLQSNGGTDAWRMACEQVFARLMQAQQLHQR